jgi:hypothetical protein
LAYFCLCRFYLGVCMWGFWIVLFGFLDVER